MVQFGGDTQATRRTPGPHELLDDASDAARRATGRVLRRPDARDASCGKSARPALGATAHVPGRCLTPGPVGRTLRSLRTGSATTCATCGSLFDEFGYHAASLYGHFGQGCVHSRIPFDLFTADGIAHVPPVRRARGRSRRVLRRVAVRRARRRAGARRAADEDVRPRDRARVRRVQSDLRPRRPDEPGQDRRAVPAGREPAIGTDYDPRR